MAAPVQERPREGRLVVEQIGHATERRLRELKVVWQLDNWPATRLKNTNAFDSANYAAIIGPHFLVHSPIAGVVDVGGTQSDLWVIVHGQVDVVDGNHQASRLLVFVMNLDLASAVLNRKIHWISRVRVSADCMSLRTQCVDLGRTGVLLNAGPGPGVCVAVFAVDPPAAFWSSTAISVDIVISVPDSSFSRRFCPPLSDSAPIFPPNFGQRLHDLQQADELTDFVLVSSDSKELKVHRAILAANCEAFRAMLRPGMKEATTGRCEITDVDYETLQLIVDAFYGRDVEERITQMPDELFDAADKYGLLDLMKKSVEAMQVTLTVSNVVPRFALAKEKELEDLKETIGNFCRSRYYEFVETDELANMTPALRKELLQLVGEKMSGQKRSASQAGL